MQPWAANMGAACGERLAARAWAASRAAGRARGVRAHIRISGRDSKALGSATPDFMVSVLLAPSRTAPRNSNTAATSTACQYLSALALTDVPKALACRKGKGKVGANGGRWAADVVAGLVSGALP